MLCCQAAFVQAPAKKLSPVEVLEQDLARVEKECFTEDVLAAAGPKIFIFSKDDLYLTAPSTQYKTISVASGFSNAIHASVANGQVMCCTSAGVLPATGNLWSVTPALQVVSDEEWGQSVGSFMIPSVDETRESYCVAKSDGYVMPTRWSTRLAHQLVHL